MTAFLRILAALFFILALAAVVDGIFRVLAFQSAHAAGHGLTPSQMSTVATGLLFTWVFAAVYGVVGMGFWQRRRLLFITILLLLILVGQWMNVGYPTGFVLSFVALGTLGFSAARSSFRN